MKANSFHANILIPLVQSPLAATAKLFRRFAAGGGLGLRDPASTLGLGRGSEGA